jgi:hypothetical protein
MPEERSKATARVRAVEGNQAQTEESRSGSRCEGECRGESSEIVETVDGECPEGCVHTFDPYSINVSESEARQDAIGYCMRRHGNPNCVCRDGHYYYQKSECKRVIEDGKVRCMFTTKTLYIGTCVQTP